MFHMDVRPRQLSRVDCLQNVGGYPPISGRPCNNRVDEMNFFFWHWHAPGLKLPVGLITSFGELCVSSGVLRTKDAHLGETP